MCRLILRVQRVNRDRSDGLSSLILFVNCHCHLTKAAVIDTYVDLHKHSPCLKMNWNLDALFLD